MTQCQAAVQGFGPQETKRSSAERERRSARWRVRAGQWGLLVAVFVFWWLMTKPGLVPPFFFENDSQAAFFFGEPDQIFLRIWEWFAGGEIYRHLFVTLYETLMAFVIGTVSGLFVGLWLARAPTAAAVLDPFIKGLNSMPRVILAPIFAVWFGNGLWHGAGGQYVLFGLYWFAAIWLGGFAEVLAQQWCPRLGIHRDGKVWRALQHVRTLGIVVVGEIIFRAPGGRAALELLVEAVRNPSVGSLFDGTVAKLGLPSADAICLVVALAALLVAGIMREKGTWSAERLWNASHLAPCLMCCALFFLVVIFGAYGAGYVPVDPMYASF